jgi:hypothetical protein
MKNKIDDVRDHLFEALERLKDEDIDGETLDREIRRAKAVREVADSIIGTAKAETDRLRLVSDTGLKSGTALMQSAEQASPALTEH